MAEMLEIECRCGRIISRTNSSAGFVKTVICPSCKRKVRIEVTPGTRHISVSYV